MGVKTFNYWNFRFVSNQLNKDALNRRHTHTNNSNYERAPCDLGFKKEKPSSLALIISSLRQDIRSLTTSEGKISIQRDGKVSSCFLSARGLYCYAPSGSRISLSPKGV